MRGTHTNLYCGQWHMLHTQAKCKCNAADRSRGAKPLMHGTCTSANTIARCISKHSTNAKRCRQGKRSPAACMAHTLMKAQQQMLNRQAYCKCNAADTVRGAKPHMRGTYTNANSKGSCQNTKQNKLRSANYILCSKERCSSDPFLNRILFGSGCACMKLADSTWGNSNSKYKCKHELKHHFHINTN